MQLSLCNYCFSVNKDYVKLQCEKAVRCKHIVTITRCYWNSLQSQSFVNDAIIELWLLWIGRHMSMVDSDILILGTHFYSQLCGPGGVQVVSSWLKNQCINVFSKKIIFVPINEHLHWSLVAVLNLNALESSSSSRKMSLDTAFLS
jgi:Ulp1 family protease